MFVARVVRVDMTHYMLTKQPLHDPGVPCANNTSARTSARVHVKNMCVRGRYALIPPRMCK
jgi:hypothetical protein